MCVPLPCAACAALLAPPELLALAHAHMQTVTIYGNGNAKGPKASLRRALKGAELEAEEAALHNEKVQRALALAQLPECNCL